MNTARIMQAVMFALLPGIAAMTFVWGLGVLWNVVLLSLACLLIEACCLLARGQGRSRRNVLFQLQDCTALLTAWLIAICLPPYTHAGLLLLAAIAAIGLAKHAYGGLGRNIFNPAMVGYVVILVSFPQSLAHWPVAAHAVDGFSGATLLTEFRYREGITSAEFALRHAAAINAQLLIAAAFLAGGLALTYKGLLAWRIPAAMFAATAGCALIGYDQGSSLSLGSAWFHWTTGGFVAAAFFIATDPVTHPRQPRQQILFGLVIGTFIYLIRAYGGFPDGIAFAVLFANCLTPLLNRVAARRTAEVIARG